MKSNIAILLSLLTITFYNPALADDTIEDNGEDHTPIYHVYDDIDLISDMKFSYDKPKIVVKAVYPRLQSDTPDEFIDTFNTLITDMVKDAIAQFKTRVKDNAQIQKNLPKSAVKNDLYIDYDTSVIKSDDNHIISIRLSIQGFIAGMAHPYHYHRVLNYNLDKGEQLELGNLFQQNSDYLNAMADYSRNVLEKRLDDSKLITEGTNPSPDNYKNWNIKPNGLFITFDENQVAPYVNGAQTVLIPYAILKPFITENSPIEACLNNTRKCGINNLLTGGFVDEAINTTHGALDPTFS